MSDVLMLEQRCRTSILQGESHFREFKSALEGKERRAHRLAKKICQDIGEALVAFANADGGELFIGVEDDGTISGMPHDDDEFDAMLAAPTTHVHADSKVPLQYAQKVILDGKTILFFSVAKGTTDIYQLPDGRCVRRKDRSTMPVSVKQLHFERQEVRSREYDRQWVDGATVADLDKGMLGAIASNYLGGLSSELYLQQVGLAEYTLNGVRLRMAALLLFANDIQRWHPRSEVRILKVAGTRLEPGDKYNVVSDEIVRGNIVQLLSQSWERLRGFLADKTEFGPDAKFEQRYIYPEQACREALVNAIAHRDYGIQNGIDVFIFDDRMVIKSPGTLLSTLTIDSLRRLEGEHESRNALVSRVLRENKFMRELGEGVKRMFEAMDLSEQAEPELHSNGVSFSITFTHRSIFTTKQQQWLDLFKNLRLTRLQKRIIVLGMDAREMSRAEIMKVIKSRDRDMYDREVTPLRNSGVLAETRSNAATAKIAKALNIKKEEVARFKVVPPERPHRDVTIPPPAAEPTKPTEVAMRRRARRRPGPK